MPCLWKGWCQLLSRTRKVSKWALHCGWKANWFGFTRTGESWECQCKSMSITMTSGPRSRTPARKSQIFPGDARSKLSRTSTTQDAEVRQPLARFKRFISSFFERLEGGTRCQEQNLYFCIEYNTLKPSRYEGFYHHSKTLSWLASVFSSVKWE